MVVARNYIGFAFYRTLDEFKKATREWIAQIDLAPGDDLYAEMVDWMDDNIAPSDEEKKTPVNLTVNDDGTITWRETAQLEED